MESMHVHHRSTVRGTRTLLTAVGLAALALPMARPAASQGAGAPPKWSSSITSGASIRRLSGGVEDALSHAGFDRFRSASCFLIFCGDGEQFPVTRSVRGWSARIGYRHSRRAELALVARYQYRFTGSLDMGPWDAGVRTLPRSRVGLGHSYVGVGIGLEIG